MYSKHEKKSKDKHQNSHFYLLLNVKIIQRGILHRTIFFTRKKKKKTLFLMKTAAAISRTEKKSRKENDTDNVSRDGLEHDGRTRHF